MYRLVKNSMPLLSSGVTFMSIIRDNLYHQVLLCHSAKALCFEGSNGFHELASCRIYLDFTTLSSFFIDFLPHFAFSMYFIGQGPCQNSIPRGSTTGSLLGTPFWLRVHRSRQLQPAQAPRVWRVQRSPLKVVAPGGPGGSGRFGPGRGGWAPE